jgi:small subunit ribosomal protein S13
MINIFNNEIKNTNNVSFLFQKTYGIGKPLSSFSEKKLGFAKNLKIKHLTKVQKTYIMLLIDGLGLKLDKDLKKLNIISLKNLVSIRLYRGLRRLKGLPVRGQRTRTNAKTCKKLNR